MKLLSRIYLPMPQNTVYSCVEDVLDTTIDNEVVLMSISEGVYIGLDEVGSRIWELLKSNASSIETLCAALQEEFEVDPQTCRTEAQAFLNDMVERGLIEATVEQD